MADWVKMRVALHRDPKTIRLKKVLAANEEFVRVFGSPGPMLGHFVVGCLVVVWGTVNDSIESDDVCHNLDLSDIDDIVSVPGFGKAMAAAGWAVTDRDGVTFPNFREFNTPSKDRNQDRIALSGAERNRLYRERNKRRDGRDETRRHGDVSRDVTSDEKCDTREEKIREEEEREEIPQPPLSRSSSRKPGEEPSCWLSREWLIHRKGAHTEHDRKSADNFADLLAAGVSAEVIVAEIRRAERPKTEPIWDLAKRLMPQKERANGQRDGVGRSRIEVTPEMLAHRRRQREMAGAGAGAEGGSSPPSRAGP